MDGPGRQYGLQTLQRFKKGEAPQVKALSLLPSIPIRTIRKESAMKREAATMYRDNTRFEFQGIKKWLKQGEYIISTISDDGTIWTYTSKALPIFDFGNTKIFQAQESGVAEVSGIEKGDEFFFSIQGIRVSKVYDYTYSEDM